MSSTYPTPPTILRGSSESGGGNLIGAQWGIAVTPSDTVQLQDSAGKVFTARWIMVGTAGDVQVKFANGDTLVFKALQPGVQYAIFCTHIYNTLTTATNITAGI